MGGSALILTFVLETPGQVWLQGALPLLCGAGRTVGEAAEAGQESVWGVSAPPVLYFP